MPRHPFQWRSTAAVLVVAATASGALAGCAGRSDVSAGSDAAKNLPAMPHATPQLRPGASQLPSVGEGDGHGHREHDHPTTSAAP